MLALTNDDDLLRSYQNGDIEAREEIARRYMPLARRLASRYRRPRMAQDDLEQVAYLGLLKTIDRFDPERGSFVGFAITTIRGELRRHLRDHGWVLHVPRPQQERYLTVSKAADLLTTRHSRAPTVRELAEHTDLSVDEVVDALDAAHGYDTRSLDAPVGADPDGSASLADLIGHEDRGYANVEMGEAVKPAFDALAEREQSIVRMRFVDDMTQSEIAAHHGVSQMQISRLLRRSLNQMLEALETQVPARG